MSYHTDVHLPLIGRATEIGGDTLRAAGWVSKQKRNKQDCCPKIEMSLLSVAGKAVSKEFLEKWLEPGQHHWNRG